MIFVTVLSALFSYLLYQTQTSEFMEGIDNKLVSGAVMARELVGPEFHDGIDGKKSVSTEAYLKIVEQYNQICKALGFQYLWSNLFLQDDTIVFTSGTSTSKDVTKGDHALFFDIHSDPAAFEPVIKAGQRTFTTFENEWGTGRMVLIPFKDIHGRNYVFGASISVDELGIHLQRTATNAFLSFLALLVVGIVGGVIFSRRVTVPLKKLGHVAKGITAGEYGLKAEGINQSSELGELAENINIMSDAVSSLKQTEDRLRQNEQALGQQEKFLSSIIENLPNMVFVKNAKDLKFVRFNKAGEKLLGFSRDQLIGKSDRDFFPREQADFFIQKDKDVLTSGETLDIPQELIETQSHGQRVLHTRKIGIYDDSGDAKYLLGISEDITDRLQTEKDLENAQRMAQVGNWVLIHETGNLYWSNQIYRVFGIDKDGFEASYEAFTDSIHPEDKEMVERAFADSLGSGTPYDIEHRIVKKDTGEIRWVHEKCAHVRDDSGTTIRSEGTVQDITERKAAEEELKEREEFQRKLLDDMLTFVAILSPDGDVVFVNNTPLKVGGLKLENVVGKKFYDAPWWTHRADVREAVISDIGRCAKGETLVRDIEIMTSNDSLMWIEFSMHPVVGNDGNVQYLIPEGRDITDRKKAEHIAAQKEAAEFASRSKSQFLANMSHEIRTPMNGVVGMAEILSRTDLKPEQTKMIRTIRNSSESLLRIIDDILDVSKIEAGKLQLENAPLCMRELSEGVMNTLRPIANEQNVRLLFDLRPHPPFINSDVIRLRQVLMNLLNNAIKFSRPLDGGKQGQVELCVERAGEHEIRFIISDNGIGMSEEAIAKLFQPFSQAEESTTRVYGGTGLGMTITKTLVDLMNGSIDVKSTPGEGTTFTVTLPVVETEGPDNDPDISGLNVLALVDDDMSRKRLSRYIELPGASIRFFETEAELASAQSAATNGTIVLLALPTASENDRVRQELSDGSGSIRYLSVVRDFGDSTECVLPDCFMVHRFPLLPSDIIRGLAVLAGRASPDVEHDEDKLHGDNLIGEDQDNRLILLVEDNETNQDVITTQLNMLGYGVEVAENGLVGLKMWQSGRYDLVLADCHMPVMDGFEMTGEIRKQEEANGENRTTIIAITANALKGESEKCIAAGMDDFLSKPVILVDLKKTLNSWLAKVG